MIISLWRPQTLRSVAERHAIMRMRRLHFTVCYLGVLIGTERDTDGKNVDYAAYEYNVYVQCNATIVRGKKERSIRQNSKEARYSPIG